jgi:hypothetical protein
MVKYLKLKDMDMTYETYRKQSHIPLSWDAFQRRIAREKGCHISKKEGIPLAQFQNK